MFLCNGHLPYNWKERVLALPEEQYQALRTSIQNPRLPESREPTIWADFIRDLSWANEFLMDDSEVAAWTTHGISVEIKRVRGLNYPRSWHPSFIAAGADPNITQGANIQISVANEGLLSVQAVRVLEDCCTDRLQDCLDSGWRILAVCPSNDSRRPDYIIGHKDKDAKD